MRDVNEMLTFKLTRIREDFFLRVAFATVYFFPGNPVSENAK